MISEWVPFLLAKKVASSTPANKCTWLLHAASTWVWFTSVNGLPPLLCDAMNGIERPHHRFHLAPRSRHVCDAAESGRRPSSTAFPSLFLYSSRSPATCSLPPWPASFCFLGPAATSMELMDIDFSPVLGFLGAPSGPASAAISSEHSGVVYLLWFSSLVASTEALRLP